MQKSNHNIEAWADCTVHEGKDYVLIGGASIEDAIDVVQAFLRVKGKQFSEEGKVVFNFLYQESACNDGSGYSAMLLPEASFDKMTIGLN